MLTEIKLEIAVKAMKAMYFVATKAPDHVMFKEYLLYEYNHFRFGFTN
jgi:hypothetical protein